ncbi:hypothetical protein CLOM621_06477 [Clostridium sp. M62/1]|nr:hypothetical protein CLOM621_06477 [Clostridium sp. M62/1]
MVKRIFAAKANKTGRKPRGYGKLSRVQRPNLNSPEEQAEPHMKRK